MTALAAGELVGGRYRIERLLGEGGMAMVYVALHTGTDRRCALKVVHPQWARQPELLERFVQEAKVTAKMPRSPYIVDVIDAGIDEARHLPFLVMELLEGEPLDRALQRGGPMDRGLVKLLIQQLGEALDLAHRAGVVHRDLKPGNLFITYDWHRRPVLKVVDFGIAKLLENQARHTATQIGTPAYAAPEQLGVTFAMLAKREGLEILQTITPATDVWPLGLIAFEMLTGAGPGHMWGVTTASELPLRVVLMPAERASMRAGERAHLLPPGFDEWCARCLERDARRRWSSAGEACSRLIQLLDGPLPELGTGTGTGTIRRSADAFLTPQQLEPPRVGSSPQGPPGGQLAHAVGTGPSAPSALVQSLPGPYIPPAPGAVSTKPRAAPKSGMLWVLVAVGVLAVASGIVAALMNHAKTDGSQADISACQQAATANTKDAWQDYLTAHPQGSCAVAAKRAIEALEMVPKDTEQDEDKTDDKADDKADRLACTKARRLATFDGWRAYKDSHPSGRCAEEAATKLKELSKTKGDGEACERARRADSLELWDAYLTDFPNGKCAAEARRGKRQNLWLTSTFLCKAISTVALRPCKMQKTSSGITVDFQHDVICSDVVFDEEGDPKRLTGCNADRFGLRIPATMELKAYGSPKTWAGGMGGWYWKSDGEAYCCPGVWMVEPTPAK